MHVEPNILFTVHEGAPFRRWCCLRSQPTPKGAPFYNAISTVAVWYRRYSVARLRARELPAVDVQPLSRVEIANHSGVEWCTRSDAFGASQAPDGIDTSNL